MLLAGLYDGSMVLVDISEMKVIDSVTAQRDQILQIIFSKVFILIWIYFQSLQTVVTIGVDTSVNLWSIQGSKLHYKKSFDTSIGHNKFAALSMDGTSLFCRFDSKGIQQWSIESGEKLCVIDLQYYPYSILNTGAI